MPGGGAPLQFAEIICGQDGAGAEAGRAGVGDEAGGGGFDDGDDGVVLLGVVGVQDGLEQLRGDGGGHRPGRILSRCRKSPRRAGSGFIGCDEDDVVLLQFQRGGGLVDEVDLAAGEGGAEDGFQGVAGGDVGVERAGFYHFIKHGAEGVVFVQAGERACAPEVERRIADAAPLDAARGDGGGDQGGARSLSTTPDRLFLISMPPECFSFSFLVRFSPARHL